MNPPETPLLAIYNDKSGKKARHRSGVVGHRWASAETAWGFDVGPGLRRNVPHQIIVFAAEKPVGRLAGTMFTRSSSTRRYGGWNSDENQNHNLGRIRFSVTDDDRGRGRPGAGRVFATIIEHSPDDRPPLLPADDDAVTFS